MSRTAIVTDSAADLTAEDAAAAGVAVLPIAVSFGDLTFRPGVDLTNEEFWARMTAPDAPFPKTAAPSPAALQATFEQCFADGASAVVYVSLSGGLSATFGFAQLARDAMPGREVHVVDSRWATYPQGLLALLAGEMAAAGLPAAEIAAAVRRRIPDVVAFVAIDTLEYLKRGGRISGAKAAFGTALSVKPIITVAEGELEQVDRVRTRARARQRLIELLCARPAERITVLHTYTPDVDEFVEQLADATGFERSKIATRVIGATIGPHLGPGALGAAILCRPA